MKRIEIHKAVLEDPVALREENDLPFPTKELQCV